MSKRTPLFPSHKNAGAKFTEFGGWEMPVSYAGLVAEHNAVRSAAGLFDVSHMGEIKVVGAEAEKFLQYVTSNDVSKLVSGKAQYSLLLNEAGGVVDDIIVYKFSDNDFFLCVNAANSDKDFAWLTKHQGKFNVQLENQSEFFAQVALQGPKAFFILEKFLGLESGALEIAHFPSFTFKTYRGSFSGLPSQELIIARTGYTGEDGFEIFYPAEFGASLWDTLLRCGQADGLVPVGLGARDSLRLEACLPLHGHELSDDLCALSCGVGWVIKFDKGDFIGKTALLKEKESGLKLKLVGLQVNDRGIVREGAKIFATDNKEVGWVSSGTMPPTVGKAIGLAFVPTDVSNIGAKFLAEVRGKFLNVEIIPTPFYKRSK